MSPTEACIIDSSSLQHAPGNDDTSFPFYKLETGKRKYQQRRLKPQTEFKEKLQTEIVDRKRKKFVGVRQRSSGRWVAEIKDTTQKIRLWLGTFDTPEDAAKAYDEAACLLRGMNTRTNFLRSSSSSPSVLPSKAVQLLLQRLHSSPGTSSRSKTQVPGSVADALVQQYLEEHPAESPDVGSTSAENALSNPVADDPGNQSEHCSHEHRVQLEDQTPESCTSLFDICDEILLPLDSPLAVDDFLENVVDGGRQPSVLEGEHPTPLFDVHELLLDPNSHCLPNPAYLKATLKCKFLENTDGWASGSLSTTHTSSEYPNLDFSPLSSGLVQAKKRTSYCNLWHKYSRI